MYKSLILSIFLLIGCISCNSDNEPENTINESRQLYIISSFQTNIPEASGLCKANPDGYYYSVSDRPTNTVFKIDSLGNIVEEFALQATDIEGITIHSLDSTIWVVDEVESKVICLNKFGQFLRSYKVEYDQVMANNGLEGIAYNSIDQHFYLLTEKNPGLLIKWMPGEGIQNTVELDFADDYSAISYNKDDDLLWITSDESAKLFLCTLDGDTIKSYDLPMNTIEGLIPTNKADEFLGISDGDSKLYRFGLSN